MILTEVNTKPVQSKVHHKKFKINSSTTEHSVLNPLYQHKNDKTKESVKQCKKSCTTDTRASVMQSKCNETLFTPLEVSLAKKHLEESLNLAPLLTLHYNSTAAGQSIKNPELAVAKWQNILRSDPNDADALFGLGEAYEKLGECIKAVACYQRYIEIVLPQKYHTKLAEERIQHLCRVIRAVYSCNVGRCI